MSEGTYSSQYFCPRLLDYVAVVGSRNPDESDDSLLEPEILRRYPSHDHATCSLPPDAAYFCQPEGCLNIGSRHQLRDAASFVFTLTEKDTGRRRYGTCINFYRPFKKKYRKHSSLRVTGGEEDSAGEDGVGGPTPQRRLRPTRSHTLTSLCIVSHHSCFSVFRECLLALRSIIDAANQKQGETSKDRNAIWNFLVGKYSEVPPSSVEYMREIETWIYTLLNTAVPQPGRAALELQLVPSAAGGSPLLLALPDHTRFSLVDFPLHLPIELLGVDLCVQALQCIMLEHKVVLQSKDYNALTMTILALVSFVYPLEYMFPVIPLLPSSMKCAEQLLMAPTPFLIGIPASFFERNPYFTVPTDIWIFDLDGTKVTPPAGPAGQLPTLPEPEGSLLKTHFKQALSSMSTNSEPPVQNLEPLLLAPQPIRRIPSHQGLTYNPFIYGNDIDSIDVATRVAMVRFFCSPNVLGNVEEHLRILRLYPRPVVGFQLSSFIKSRPLQTAFASRLACTQAVEYFMEWSLSPSNVVYKRVQTGVYDPVQIGDKPRWYQGQLARLPQISLLQDHSILGRLLITKEKLRRAHSGDSSSGADGSSDSDEESGPLPRHSVRRPKLVVIEKDVYKPPTAPQAPASPTDGSVRGSINVRREGRHKKDEDSSSSSDSENSDDEDEDGDGKDTDGRCDVNSHVAEDPTVEGQLKQCENSIIPEGGRVADGNLPSKPKIKPPRPPPPSISREPSVDTENASKDGPPPSPLAKIASLGTDFGGFATSKLASLMGTPKEESPKSDRARSTASQGRPASRSPRRPRQSATPSKDTGSRGSPQTTPKRYRESQAFLKEVINHVLDGQGVSWFKQGRIKKLMEDEGFRVFTLTRLNPHLETKLSTEEDIVPDVRLPRRGCYKGMLTMLRLISAGLEVSFKVRNKTGMASTFLLLETAHTHYYAKESKSTGSSRVSSPFGSGENLALSLTDDSQPLPPPSKESSASGESPSGSIFTSFHGPELSSLNVTPSRGERVAEGGKPSEGTAPGPMDNGGEKMTAAVDTETKIGDKAGDRLILGARRDGLNLHGLSESESCNSLGQLGSPMGRSPISHQTLRKGGSEKGSPSEGSENMGTRSLKSLLESRRKSQLGSGLRYTNGKLSSDDSSQSDSAPRCYLFEGLIGKGRVHLWDYMQFWEDMFLDCVAQEREFTGMDEDPSEMLGRYQTLSDGEKRRLEQAEDRLLAIVLYNVAAFMVMMRCSMGEVKRKVRRLLGKSHIGLLHSQHINNLLDSLDQLNGNDIDLKVLPSRSQQKHSFSVYYGTISSGDMLFMDVCDDCVVVREVSGVVVDRWWYESLVNLTYCPKTRVLCLWRRLGEQTQLTQFYAKKCRELYSSVKEAMERVAASSTEKQNAGPELGGQFPVEDVISGQSGILQVCMDGIGLLLDNAKFFVELKRIKRCFTQKGGVFVLEELDIQTGTIKQRKYRSNMANEISYSVLCVFSYMASSGDASPNANAS